MEEYRKKDSQKKENIVLYSTNECARMHFT